jgi:hypothetical protein
MIRTIYLSKANRTFSHPELLSMSLEFAAANVKRDVTGVLLRIGNYFVQILEGEDGVVTDLMEKITRDLRHGAITTLLEQRDISRAFANWSMNLIDCETIYYVNLIELRAVREQIATMVVASDDQKKLFSSLILELVDCVRSSRSREPLGAAQAAST